MSKHLKRPLVVFGLLAVTTTAFALPWTIDMADSKAVKAFEQPMRTLPEGVVAQPNILTPRSGTPNVKVSDDNINDIRSPYKSSGAVTRAAQEGKVHYERYCTPCHGDGLVLGPVSNAGFPAVPALSGKDGRLQRLSDGWVYSTIRNGSLSQIMPAYGYAMSDREIWQTIHYVRTMENGRYNKPTPDAAGSPQ